MKKETNITHRVKRGSRGRIAIEVEQEFGPEGYRKRESDLFMLSTIFSFSFLCAASDRMSYNPALSSRPIPGFSQIQQIAAIFCFFLSGFSLSSSSFHLVLSFILPSLPFSLFLLSSSFPSFPFLFSPFIFLLVCLCSSPVIYFLFPGDSFLLLFAFQLWLLFRLSFELFSFFSFFLLFFTLHSIGLHSCSL